MKVAAFNLFVMSVALGVPLHWKVEQLNEDILGKIVALKEAFKVA